MVSFEQYFQWRVMRGLDPQLFFVYTPSSQVPIAILDDAKTRLGLLNLVTSQMGKINIFY